jgi:16S rRNA (cytosine967-C5)-methyltransferase
VGHVERLVRRFPDLPLDPVDFSGLEPREASMAHSIVDVVTRRWLLLEYLLQQGLNKDIDEMEPRVRAILMCAAAQMMFFDRVPVRAAIHEAVEQGKRCRRDAGGLVNAAMRRLQEIVCEGESAPVERVDGVEDARNRVPTWDGRSIVLTRDGLPEDRMHRLSLVSGCPMELLRLLSRSMSLEEVRGVALHSICLPPTVFRTSFAREELDPELFVAHEAEGHHVFVGGYRQMRDVIERRDDIWVQDSASSAAVDSVSDLEPGLIVDVCAGKGTKTRQLSHVFPESRIVATDVSEDRWKLLAGSFAGHGRVEVVEFGALDGYAQQADLILLDVPCSNTGVLARRVEARYRAGDEKKLDGLVQMQRQIVADAMRLLSVGGAVLYSTCSLDPRENEEQLEWASRWHSLEIERSGRRLPVGGPGKGDGVYSDGSFSGLLRG